MPKDDLIEMLIFSDGLEWKITVTAVTASKIGHYMNAVGRFRRNNDLEELKPYKGVIIDDVKGEQYILETRPNAIHRLISSATETFEDVYRVVT